MHDAKVHICILVKPPEKLQPFSSSVSNHRHELKPVFAKYATTVLNISHSVPNIIQAKLYTSSKWCIFLTS
ncbi:Hypothetical predicted protein [Cloeon dipterum]|uniref:Uncharacterized protein n=1 Tax=Cloeon dipterum TaxID=197152 RepID=A0A8S1DJV6_9INSE|nr:Hypothetical predicted protein [Cloeon dipterum]